MLQVTCVLSAWESLPPQLGARHPSLLRCGDPALALGESPLHTCPWSFVGAALPLRVTSGEWFYCLLPSPHRKVTSKAVRMRRKSVPCTHRRRSAFSFVLLRSFFLAVLASDPLAEIPYLLLLFQQGNPLFWLCQNYMLKSNKSWFQRPW